MKMHAMWLLICVAVAVPATQRADEGPKDFPAPSRNSAKEPFAKQFSLAKAAEFLDNVAVTWTRENGCVTCHTNCPYLIARPLIGKESAGMAEVRKFFESQAGAIVEKAKISDPTEIITVAGVLAINDRHTTGKLQPLTKKALDAMWTLQKPDGGWEWIKCGWPPLEHDDYFGTVFAALALGQAPDGYANADELKGGMAKLKGYFRKNPAPSLHHKAWLLWSSISIDGLMTKDDRAVTVKELRSKQRPDGGWCLPALGDWKGYDGRKNNPSAPSDGYGTGLVIAILRQAGVPANDPQIQKGIHWLKTNQRESGRWFTRSLNTETSHYIANAGTSWAVLALKACE